MPLFHVSEPLLVSKEILLEKIGKLYLFQFQNDGISRFLMPLCDYFIVAVDKMLSPVF